MSNHSVIEHKANYYYVKVEEDFVAICLEGKTSPHCKALILAILENWTNAKRDKGEEPDIYMSYPMWMDATFHLYGRNVIIDCLNELLAQGLIGRAHYSLHGRDSFTYRLVVPAIQARLNALPERQSSDTRPKINASYSKRVEKGTHSKTNGKSENAVLNQTPHPFEKGRNIESITQITENTEQEGDVPVGVATRNDAPVAHATPASSSSRLPQADVFGEEEVETSPRGKILHIANGTRTTPSEKKREDYSPPPRLSPVPLIPSDEAKKIIGAWSSLFPRSLPVNDALVKAAEALVPCHPSVEDLQKVRDFCVESNPEWYGTNGRTKGRVTLQDIVKNWEGWLSSEQGKHHAKEKQEAKANPKVTSRMQELREKQRHFSVPPSSSRELHEPQERYEQVGG